MATARISADCKPLADLATLYQSKPLLDRVALELMFCSQRAA